MKELLFTFEEEKMPFPVILATIALIAIFALGILYQVLTALLL